MDDLQRMFASAIRSERRRKKLSQSQLAKKSGVKRDLIASIEGERRAVNTSLYRLALALDNTVEGLIEDMPCM